MAITLVGSTSFAANNPTDQDFTLPAGWAPGDVAVFWWYTYAYTKTFNAPTGVTQKRTQGLAGYGRMYIGYRVLQVGDSSFNWTALSVANSTTVWGTSVFHGVVTSGDPFEAQSGAIVTFANAINPNPPSVVTITSGACVVPIFGKMNDYTSITPPLNYTTAGSNSSTLGNDASAGVAYRIIASPGTVDPPAWTLGGGLSTDDGMVWTGALKPSIIVTGFRKLQYATEPPSAGVFNKLKYFSEPPVPGAWNKLAYEGE